jgi:hypothetical protein
VQQAQHDAREQQRGDHTVAARARDDEARSRLTRGVCDLVRRLRADMIHDPETGIEALL